MTISSFTRNFFISCTVHIGPVTTEIVSQFMEHITALFFARAEQRNQFADIIYNITAFSLFSHYSYYCLPHHQICSEIMASMICVSAFIICKAKKLLVSSSTQLPCQICQCFTLFLFAAW